VFHVRYLTHYKSDSRDDTHQGERSRENNGGLEQKHKQRAAIDSGLPVLRIPQYNSSTIWYRSTKTSLASSKEKNTS